MTTTISIQTARRYILGRQGLWPGRRWRGIRGTERAMRTMEHVQLDPLVVIARAHDVMLAAVRPLARASAGAASSTKST